MEPEEIKYNDLCARVTRIEIQLAQIEFMLKDMREIFSQGFEALSEGNKNRRDSIQELNGRVDRDSRRIGSSLVEIWDFVGFLGDKINATYEAVFPGRTEQFRDEVARAMRGGKR